MTSTCLLLCLNLFLPFGAEEHRLIIPRLADRPGTHTGIALSNTGGQTLSVRLTAYDDAGRMPRGERISNPVQLEVRPGSQVAEVALSLFGSGWSDSNGIWVAAESGTPALTGFFLQFDQDVTWLDGAVTPAPARELVFEAVPPPARGEAKLTLVNPNPEHAGVLLNLVTRGGPSERSLIIPPWGSSQVSVASDLGSSPTGEPGHVLVKSQVPVAGYQLVETGADAWAVNAKPVTGAASELLFPQLAVGPPYRSELYLVHLGTGTAEIIMEAFQPDGTPFGPNKAHTSRVTRVVGPSESLYEDLEETFGFRGGLSTGWLRVRSASPTLLGTLVYSVPEQGMVAAVAAAHRSQSSAVFSHIATTLDYFTGIALLNPGSAVANYTLLAVRSDGSQVGTCRGALLPGQRESRLLTEFVPETAGLAGGIVWIVADTPLAMTSLFGRLQTGSHRGVLANIPPQSPAGGFAPGGAEVARLEPTLIRLSPGATYNFSPPPGLAESSGPSAQITRGQTGTVSTMPVAATDWVWKVNGRPGGDTQVGTVTAGGMYRAPAAEPLAPVAVTLEWSRRGIVEAVGATVDVAGPSTLPGTPLLAAHSQFRGEWYLAELSGGNTRILRRQGSPAAQIAGQQLRGLLSWQALDGKEYLLAATSAGRLLRLDPRNGQSAVLLEGLNNPGKLALDPITGNLLIAEAAFLSKVASFALNHGLGTFSYPDRRREVLVPGVQPAQAAVDPCTGHVYVVETAAGRLVRWDRITNRRETVREGLLRPVALEAVFRSGVSCPAAIRLLIAESGSGALTLYSPAADELLVWATIPGIQDVELVQGWNLEDDRLLAVTGGITSFPVFGVWTPDHPALPSQVRERFQREILRVGAVAPDMLAVSLRSGKRIGARQVPYQPEPGDMVELSGEYGSVWLRRGGQIVGALVGPERNVLCPFDRLQGVPALLAGPEGANRLKEPRTYLIESQGDPALPTSRHPLAVYRRTAPWDMVQTGVWSFEWPLEHTLYFRFPGPLKAGATYRIRFDESFLPEITYHHDPDRNLSEAVLVSQVGFRPDDPFKGGYVAVWMGDGGGLSLTGSPTFQIRDEDGSPVLSGPVILGKAAADRTEDPYNRNYSGVDVYRLDFSELSRPGVYRACLQGVGCSQPFEVGPEVWRRAHRRSARGFYHQRSGISIGPPFSRFERPRAFHPDDGMVVYASTATLADSGNGLDANGNRDGNFGDLVAGKTSEPVPQAWGGYFDAGDWDRRIQHLEAARLLLELILAFPGAFEDGELGLPESGNGVPDLLDEAIWGLDVYRRMQTPSGGIRGGIESAEHPRYGETSWQESLPVMAYAPDVWSSFIYAGVAARASLALERVGPALAQVYRDSALRAAAWAESEYPAWLQSRPAQPADPDAVANALNEVRDARNLAALELYRLTGDPNWHRIFLETTKFTSPAADPAVWRSHNQRDAAFLYCLLESGDVDAVVQNNARNAILREAARSVQQSQRTGFNWTKQDPWEPVGFGKLSAPQAVTLARAHRLTGDPELLRTIVAACQTGIGANPLGLSYTTGIGFRQPLHPLVVDQRRTNQEPPQGITVYGPFDMETFAKGHWAINLMAPALYPTVDRWPTLSAYFDIFLFPETTEFTVMQTLGPTAYVFGYLAVR